MSERTYTQAEVDALMAKRPAGKLSCKVSTKGAVSVYGLGRWPVTLYRSQFERLIEATPAIQAFIKANAAALAVKAAA